MEEKKKYEIGYLLSPLVPADKLADVISDEISAVIEKDNGEVIGRYDPKIRTLAYPIKKTIGHKKTVFKESYFGALNFTLAPEKISKLKEKLSKNNNLIRFLITFCLKEPPTLSSRLVKTRSIGWQSVKPADQTVGLKKGPNQAEIDREIEDLLSSV